MPKPISRREMIRRFKKLGWEGPFPGGKHEGMRHPKTKVKIPLPNPHKGDLDWSLVKRILKQAGIQNDDWDQTKD